MDSWNAMTPGGKGTILRVVRQEAEQFFDLVDDETAWRAPTGAGHWQVRDIVAHLVDTTESYFVAFDAARNGRPTEPAYGLPGMAKRVDTMAQALRSVPRQEAEGLTVLEFDPGSFVLTAFGRSNAGTIRGDRAVADRFLNIFFRI